MAVARSRVEEEDASVDGEVVPLEVRLLLEPLVADAADVLWRFAAFVTLVPVQGAFLAVDLSAVAHVLLHVR